MFRLPQILVAVALALPLVLGPATADAYPYSRNNPFTSYNVHGTNYASQQWEKNHGRRSARSQFARRANTTRFRRGRL